MKRNEFSGRRTDDISQTWFCERATSEGSRPPTAPTADVASLPSRDADDDDRLLAGEWSWFSTAEPSMWSWSRTADVSGGAQTTPVAPVDLSLRSIGSDSVVTGNDIGVIAGWWWDCVTTDAVTESICLSHQSYKLCPTNALSSILSAIQFYWT